MLMNFYNLISIHLIVMSSFTVTLTGNSSELSTSIFPEIILDDRYEYSCGLLDFTTYHSIPNITKSNNRLYYVNNVSEDIVDFSFVEVPVGSYELEEILERIKIDLDAKGHLFEYIIDKNALKTHIKCSVDLIFTNDNSIHHVLGFNSSGIKAERDYQCSDGIIRITPINIIRIECNIVSGSYINGRPCHSIYEFASNKVNIGHKIIEQPPNIIYLPITSRQIDFIQISVVDQNGRLIDFRGEDITCRIHIKRGQRYSE